MTLHKDLMHSDQNDGLSANTALSNQYREKRKVRDNNTAAFESKRSKSTLKYTSESAKQAKSPLNTGTLFVGRALLLREIVGDSPILRNFQKTITWRHYKSYKELPVILEAKSSDNNNNAFSTINCLDFDSLGALLASGNSKGTLRVYDFDEYLCKYYNHLSRKPGSSDTSCDICTTSKQIERQLPLVEIQTPINDLQVIEWNTSNEKFIACGGYCNFNGFNIYNLELETEKAALALRSSNNNGAHVCIKFTNNGSLVLSGTARGAIKSWDTRKTCKTIWEVQAEGQKHMVTSILPAQNQRHFYSASMGGKIALWDLRKMKTSIFGIKAQPRMIQQWSTRNLISDLVEHIVDSNLNHRISINKHYFRGDGIVSMERNPENSNEVWVRMASGWIGILNISLGCITKFCPLMQNSLLNEYNVTRMDENSDSIQRCPPTSVKRNCGRFFSSGSRFCASLPAQRAIYVIDASQSALRMPNELSGNPPLQNHWTRYTKIDIRHVPTSIATHPYYDFIAFGSRNLSSILVAGA